MPGIAALIQKRQVNGGDFWAGADGRWGIGSPFSTLDCGLMLAELGLSPADPVAAGIVATLLRCQTVDGRIRPGPHLAVQPCHTGSALRLLCRWLGGEDPRLAISFEHLLATPATDGGWRCSVLKYGTGPDTDPGAAFVGGANSMWLRIATNVPLTAGTTYTVTQTSNNPADFVSQRAHGVMWEYVGPIIPEPTTLSLAGLGLLGLVAAGRRKAA